MKLEIEKEMNSEERIVAFISSKEELDEWKKEIGLLPQYNKKEIKVPTHQELWDKCKKLLQQRFGERKYQLIKDVQSKSFDDAVLTLAVKDMRMVEKLEKLFDMRRKDLGIYAVTLREVYGEDLNLMYDTETV